MPSRFLILRLSAIGDVIRTLPAVRAVKEHFPGSHITWVTEEPSESLLRSQPEIDDVILFPRKRWAGGIKSIRRIWETLREMKNFVSFLRKQKFDVALDFHGILKSGIISLLSGAPKRIGFDRKAGKEWNYVFSNVRVSLTAGPLSRYDRNFALLKGTGFELKKAGYGLSIPSEDQKYVDSFFSKVSPALKKPVIVIHAGTSPKTAYKRWMPYNYAELADRLVCQIKASVIFTWGAAELEWVEGIRNRMRESSILAPRTETLTQLAEIFRRCDLYIGGDTGPMHIATCVDVPVIVIYGPTDPLMNEPFGRHLKIRKEVGCNPCRNRGCKDRRCLEAITADDVLDGAKKMLNSPPYRCINGHG